MPNYRITSERVITPTQFINENFRVRVIAKKCLAWIAAKHEQTPITGEVVDTLDSENPEDRIAITNVIISPMPKTSDEQYIFTRDALTDLYGGDDRRILIRFIDQE